MSMRAILFNGAEPFEQTVNAPLREGLMWNCMKIGQGLSAKKMVSEMKRILYMNVAQGQGQTNPRGQNFDCN